MVRKAKPGEINYHVADRFTFAHAGMGALLSALGAPPWVALSLSVAWEVAEPGLKKAYPHVFPHQTGDTPANKVGDVAAWMAGFALVEGLKRAGAPSTADPAPALSE